MASTCDTTCGHGGEEAHATNSYESNTNELLFGMDCQMLGNDPENCPISTSAPSDPNSLNAFFQSIVHTSNNIFQPQPILASSYHQLIHLPHEPSSQPGSFEQNTGVNFSNVHSSPQSGSSIFENESFQSVQLPFDFIPLGVAASCLTDSANIHSMTDNSGLCHLSTYYHNLTSQNITSGQESDSLPGPPSTSAARESLQPATSAVPILGTSQTSHVNDGMTQYRLEAEGHDRNHLEETPPGGDLNLALSSCALIDNSSAADTQLVQSLSPSRSNKRSHPVTPASDPSIHRKYLPCNEAHPATCRSKNQDRLPNISTLHSLRATNAKVKSKNLKRTRQAKSHAQPRLTSHSDHLNTPSRPNILANKKIHPNILPPTPDSMQRPKNQSVPPKDELESVEEAGQKKKQKIESIERALEALDTLTEYLSQEANECASISDDTAEYLNPSSPHQSHCNSRLSLVSPQHFFTLGELGGRLRRRLDVQRR